MSEILDRFFDFLKHLDQIFDWLREALKFYVQPKLFIENLLAIRTKKAFKKIIGYFLFIESLLLIIAATLIDEIQFGLFKILGLLVLDVIVAAPLIIIVSIALWLGKVASPIKKSVYYVLLFKIFYVIPIYIFLFLFVYFENYVFYILFGACAQLFIIIQLFLPALLFCKKIKQALVVSGVAIGMFILIVFIFLQAGRLNPSADELANRSSFFDPIFSEFIDLREKARIIDEVDSAEDIRKIDDYLSLIEAGNGEISENKVKAEYDYHNQIIAKKINDEVEIFSKNRTYYFDSNRKRFRNYLSFLYELTRYREKLYEFNKIFDYEIAIRKNQKENEQIKHEIEKYPKFKITEIENDEFNKMTWAEKINRLKDEVKQREIASKYMELMIRQKEIEESIIKNKIRKQEILGSIYKEATKLEEAQIKFKYIEMNYYAIVLAMRKIIFIY